MISRPAKIALGIGAAVLGVVVLGAGLFVWQLMSGGRVPIGFFAGQIEAAINSSLKGVQVDLGDGAVEFTKDQQVAHFRFENIKATDRVGNVIARVPKANVALSGPALMNGEFAPISVEVSGASALLVRRKDGGFQMGLQVGDDAQAEKQDAASPGVTKAVLEAMLNPKPKDMLSRYLTRIAIVDAKLKLFDEETKSYWTAEKASLVFDRKPNGVVVSVNAPIRLHDKSTWMFTAAARYQTGSDNVALEAAFKPVRLSVLAASGSGLKALSGFNIPVNGNASCDLKVSGQMGRCKLWLNAGTGALKLPALKPEPIHLKTAALTVELDFPSQRYAIEEMTWTGQTIRGKVTGDGAFAFAADGALQTLTADWTAENIFIDAPNVFDGGGLALETMKLRAAFDAARAHLAIEEIHASKGDFDLALSGEMQDHPVSTGVVLNGGFKNLTVANLKRLWPAGAAAGARDWLITNAHEGFIPNGTVAVNIAPGAIVGGKIPDEMMNIALAMEGVKATYLDGLPDMTNVKGTATAMGDTFKMELTGGNIGRLSLTNGSLVIPNLHQHGTVGTIAGAVTGPTRDLLELLDRPRLGYPTRYGIKVAESGGSANVKFTFGIPMLRDLKADDIGVDVDGEFKDVKLPINELLRLTGGVFNVKLSMKGLKAHGAVQVNTAPMGFTWTEDFTGTAPIGTRLDVTATLNTAHRAALGLDLGRYVEGKTAVIAAFTGRNGKLERAKVDANLTGARLVAAELGWAKPEDANGAFKADVVFRPDRLIEINNIDAAGQGFKAQGRLVVGGGKIRQADFKRLQLGPRNDFALVYRDDDQTGFVFDARGKVIDAGGFLEQNEEEPKGTQPMSVKADMDLAYLRGDVWFTGVKFEYGSDGENLTAFKADASADAANVRGELIRGADNSRKLKLQTADAGRLVRAATGFRSLIGGDLSLAVDLSPMPGPGQGKAQNAYDGVLKIEKFKIVNQPFLARLLAAGSFTGLDDLMRGEGITFSKLEQVFQGRGDLITLTSGRAAGPSIGLTAEGTLNRASDRIDLHGTIVPLYGLNSIFGEVPLIGDILGSRDGEGIFGVTYGVSGQVDELRVAVNPVSMLAPGFLRKIFQMGPTPQAAAPMTAPPPEPKPDVQQKKSLAPETRTN